MSAEYLAWQEHNREYLALAIDVLHAHREEQDPTPAQRQTSELLERMTHAPALDQLAEAFALGRFETDLVLLCLASELDPRFRTDAPAVTVGVALETLDGANWAALDDAGPLKEWGIVTTERDAKLADADLTLARDVLRFLLGFDPRTGSDSLLTAATPPPHIVESQFELATALGRAIATTLDVTDQAPAVELHGGLEEDRLTVAFATAELLGTELASADVRDLPAPGQELDELLLTWGRIARLTATLPYLITHADRADDPSLGHRVERALTKLRGPFFLSADRPGIAEPVRPVIRRAVPRLTFAERAEVWSAIATRTAHRLESEPPDTKDLARDYRLGARAVQRICLEAEALAAGDPEVDLTPLLRSGCARTIRAKLDPLADRVDEHVTQIELPAQEAAQLIELEDQIRLAADLATEWGIGPERGVTALFAGPSGTGKTHAAKALATRLGLDLYRVDLAGVLSKYIGETEKNLDRIFDGAEIGGAILLFDEADALFGKRSEVRDSHDRYANLSTAYLLARIERSTTTTILTSNLKDAIDPAFLRRLHFVIDFPFPAEPERERIWDGIYPRETPTAELEPQRLAAVAVTGGTIHNIARRGAFLAAAEPSAIAMRHLYEGTRRELKKASRDLSPEERSAWR